MRVQPAIPVPTMFGGRKVTSRGVHMQPTGQWGVFLQDPDAWIERLVRMHVSIVVALTDSDSILIQKKDGLNPIELLFRAGIIPIVRFNISNLPQHFTHQVVTEQLVALYARYGAPLWLQYLNEPGDIREWKDSIRPPDWWEIWTSRWREGARQMIERGAMVLIPDGPCYDKSPFPDCLQGIEHYAAEGWIGYGSHDYALNRPIGKDKPTSYPYDDAQRLGTQMSQEQYDDALHPFQDDPNWQDPPLSVLNAEREAKKNPTLQAWGEFNVDTTCWRGWEQVEYWMQRDLGFSIPHFMTEGGVTPKARAGSTQEDMERRYTLPTPLTVARDTLAMFNVPDSPFTGCCPWLLASVHLGGSNAWEDDAWCGGSWFAEYGFEKPVVQTLADNPPGQTDPVLAYIKNARAYIAQSLAALE
jgi:hypothetical protein